MKKVVIAFDGRHFSDGALEMAAFLNEKSPVLLTGAFLPQVDYARLWSYSGSGRILDFNNPLSADDAAVKENIERFKNWCVKSGVEHRVHDEFYDFTLPELKKESRFADLLIIGSETFYENAGGKALNEYLKDALHNVECPVIVVPEKFTLPDTTILAYDGSPSSVYAIRQFACLFPELTFQKTILVYAGEKTGKSMPDEDNIKELAARHFTDLTIQQLDADPKIYFTAWLNQNKGAILVTGSFGRSGISRFFHKSFVTDIIRQHQMPVFIAHL